MNLLIAPPKSDAAETLLEAWKDALAEVLADVLESERRIWQRERALIEAQAQSTIATLQAAVATLRVELSDMVRARIAELKDGEPGVPGERGLPGEVGPV